MSDQHPRQIDPDQIMYVERQRIEIPDFPCAPSGWILDLGGGGEGIIGQLKGHRVVSIDPIRRELEEVSNAALKIVMDGRQMGFLDNTFETATAFFCLMYIDAADQPTVLSEVARVLLPGGELWLWDAVMPEPEAVGRGHFRLPLVVVMPDGREIRTGYGVVMKRQDTAYFAELGARAGFEVLEQEQHGDVLWMRMRKAGATAGGGGDSGE